MIVYDDIAGKRNEIANKVIIYISISFYYNIIELNIHSYCCFKFNYRHSDGISIKNDIL